MPDDVQFCGSCGNKIEAKKDAPGSAETASSNKPPEDGKAKTAQAPAAQKSGNAAKANPKVLIIGAIVVAAVIVIAVAVSCSSSATNSTPKVSSSSSSSSSSETSTERIFNSMIEDMYGSGKSSASSSSSSQSTSSSSWSAGSGGSSTSGDTSKYAGMWRDPEYGDTMSLSSDGSGVITQDGKRFAGTWSATSNGIVFQLAGGQTYTFAQAASGGLYNSDKQLYFVKS